jgi:hypothetical protein
LERKEKDIIGERNKFRLELLFFIWNNFSCPLLISIAAITNCSIFSSMNNSNFLAIYPLSVSLLNLFLFFMSPEAKDKGLAFLGSLVETGNQLQAF